MDSIPGDFRQASTIHFAGHPPIDAAGARRWVARGQDFVVEWIESAGDAAPVFVDSAHEMIVLPIGASAFLSVGAGTATAPPRSVCIVPAGRLSLSLAAGGRCAVFCSQRSDLSEHGAINAGRYRSRDPRIAGPAPAWPRRQAVRGIEVIAVDGVQAPADNPRLKMFQSETLSINWAEYAGPRDRALLSPHSHADFEQGSLAVEGEFMHHMRWPWGRDANLWHDDEHLPLRAPSLVVTPPEVIHTTEGLGTGNHLLIDIFSPPRRDFFDKGWVANGSGYEPPRR
jgi:hypothetical protein